MSRFIKRISKNMGLPAGTLVHIGDKPDQEALITVFDYDESSCTELHPESADECLRFKATPTVTWINIDGVHDVELIAQLGKLFGIHPLSLEDSVNTGQRPKFEEFETYLCVVLKMLYYDPDSENVCSEQLGFMVGDTFVLSFQERKGDVFDSVRERIRSDRGRIRKMGADYLLYVLIDAIVDNYFIILERFGDRLEELEEVLLADPNPATLREIHGLKRELLFMRRAVWPLREVIGGLQRLESSLIRDTTLMFLRDVYDHTIQVIDTVETFRDMVSGMLDIYLSSVSNRMNEVMKVLTIIATIFIPITFIAGIYGMNFKYMPELEWPFGYALVWGVILAVTATMVVFFKKKDWF